MNSYRFLWIPMGSYEFLWIPVDPPGIHGSSSNSSCLIQAVIDIVIVIIIVLVVGRGARGGGATRANFFLAAAFFICGAGHAQISSTGARKNSNAVKRGLIRKHASRNIGFFPHIGGDER